MPTPARKEFENNNQIPMNGRYKGKRQREGQKCFSRCPSLCEIQSQEYGGLGYGENHLWGNGDSGTQDT